MRLLDLGVPIARQRDVGLHRVLHADGLTALPAYADRLCDLVVEPPGLVVDLCAAVARDVEHPSLLGITSPEGRLQDRSSCLISPPGMREPPPGRLLRLRWAVLSSVARTTSALCASLS